MRRLLKNNSTKAERILYEYLKVNHIHFKHRWIVEGREIDFIVGKHAIELDGHEQDEEKNNMLIRNGYIPIHIHNDELLKNREIINQIICLLLDSHYQES